jgi:hypothetical protein
VSEADSKRRTHPCVRRGKPRRSRKNTPEAQGIESRKCLVRRETRLTSVCTGKLDALGQPHERGYESLIVSVAVVGRTYLGSITATSQDAARCRSTHPGPHPH